MSFPVNEFVVTGVWAFQIGTYKTKLILQDDSVIEDEGNPELYPKYRFS